MFAFKILHLLSFKEILLFIFIQIIFLEHVWLNGITIDILGIKVSLLLFIEEVNYFAILSCFFCICLRSCWFSVVHGGMGFSSLKTILVVFLHMTITLNCFKFIVDFSNDPLLFLTRILRGCHHFF